MKPRATNEEHILGVDPSLNATGWCVIKINHTTKELHFIASGTIKANKITDYYKKLQNIHDNILNLIIKYNIQNAFMEETFVNNNAQSSLKLGVTRGVIMGTMLSRSIAINELSPTIVKKSITGNGKADKQQVAYMLQFLLPKITINNFDEADATAVAIAGYLLHMTSVKNQ